MGLWAKNQPIITMALDDATKKAMTVAQSTNNWHTKNNKKH
jgi:hypothetical protein